MVAEDARLYQLVGKRIRRKRNEVGISQAALAKKLGMSRTSIVNVEAGRQRPPLHVLWGIAEQLGTEVTLLIPKQRDYKEASEPVELDSEIVRQIEKAASGDQATRRNLTRFIASAVAHSEEE